MSIKLWKGEKIEILRTLRPIFFSVLLTILIRKCYQKISNLLSFWSVKIKKIFHIALIMSFKLIWYCYLDFMICSGLITDSEKEPFFKKNRICMKNYVFRILKTKMTEILMASSSQINWCVGTKFLCSSSCCWVRGGIVFLTKGSVNFCCKIS